MTPLVSTRGRQGEHRARRRQERPGDATASVSKIAVGHPELTRSAAQPRPTSPIPMTATLGVPPLLI